MQYKEKDELFSKKEKRDVALTVRLPKATVKKIKTIAKKYNYSQSEVVETLVEKVWASSEDQKIPEERTNMQTEMLNKLDLHSIGWNFDNNQKEAIHNIHPYPAKFIPEIPRNLIANLAKPSSKILDPFCGSGTTLKEAQSAGFESTGIDLNPIACLISTIKTSRLPANLLQHAENGISYASKYKGKKVDVDIPNINHWFNESSKNAIYYLRKFIEKEESAAVRDHLNLCLSSIIVRISNQESDTRYAAIPSEIEEKECYDLFMKSVQKLVEAKCDFKKDGPTVTVINKDVLKVTPVDLGRKFDLIITSPPYPNAYEYWLYHKYRMFWLNHNPLSVKASEIGARAHFFKKNHHTKDDFLRQMGGVFSLLKDVSNKNAFCCFVVGRSIIHGEEVDNSQIIKKAAEANNFGFYTELSREIGGTKKSFNPQYAKIKKEDILIFQKR